MAISVRDAVEIWKARPPRPTDIPLEAACALIGTKDQPFEAKRTGQIEWVLCRAGENTPAVFSYAAVYAGGDPPDTGNILEPGNEDEGSLTESNGRFERVANFKCNYSYSFDTSQDQGLFGTQAMIDAYMENVPGFNTPLPKPRRLWQSGSGPSGTNRFWMRIPMFLKLRDREWKGEPPRHLHEWVKEADRRSRMYRANPCRPSVFNYDGQVLRDIKECEPPELVRGDGVALTFSISYIIGHRDWYPTYALIDVVRVASERSSSAIDGLQGMVILKAPYRAALRAGDALDGDAADDWEIEDLHPPGSLSHPVAAANGGIQNANTTILGGVDGVENAGVPPERLSAFASDSMDVDDAESQGHNIALDTPPSVENGVKRSIIIKPPRKSYSSASPVSETSSRWSDSAVEEDARPPERGFLSLSAHSDSEDVGGSGGFPPTRRQLRSRR